MDSEEKKDKISNLRLRAPTKPMRTEEEHLFHGRIRFTAVQDHILESKCQHVSELVCQVCKYENDLPIPQLPEMIFPNNSLTLSRRRADGTEQPFLQFNTFDALNFVEVGRLPDVQVKPSATWQEARKELPLTDFQKPFDWTYTSAYKGTLLADGGVREEPTDEPIDFEKLKQRDPILFYSQMTLYEDELSDHGCSQMDVRVRVMPNSFFILCRFYLRVDDVMVRIYDTRLFGEADKPYIIKEWSSREAAYQQLTKNDLHNVLDANLIWPALPEHSMERTKLVLGGD